MNYNIKGTDVSITDEIRTYLEKKLTHLEKFVHKPELARADVELQYLPSEGKMYRAEVMLIDPSLKQPLRAEATANGLHEAIDKVESELFSELTRSRKKRLQNFRHSAVKVKEFLRGWRNSI